MDAEQKSAKGNNLLDTLQREVGCPYLSNLHEPLWAEALLRVIGGIADETYSIEQWRKTTSYITGKNCSVLTAADAKEQLCVQLSNPCDKKTF